MQIARLLPPAALSSATAKIYEQKVKAKPISAAASLNTPDTNSDEHGFDAHLSMAAVPPEGGEVKDLSKDTDHLAIPDASPSELVLCVDPIPNADASELLAEAQEEIKRLMAQAEASRDEHEAELQREMATRS